MKDRLKNVTIFMSPFSRRKLEAFRCDFGTPTLSREFGVLPKVQFASLRVLQEFRLLKLRRSSLSTRSVARHDHDPRTAECH